MSARTSPGWTLQPAVKQRINSALGGWFFHHARDFPWRRTRDPYKVFVAETLLRKTRAVDAVPVYCSIVQRYPSVGALSRATRQSLKGLIAPIGLPSRGDMMLAAASVVAVMDGGRMPETKSALLALPGVGEYIASAVASFAYDCRTPVVDGGVARLLTRTFGVRPSSPAYCDPAIRSVADQLLPMRNVRAHNLALLDLSAAACRPTAISCESCPLRNLCVTCRPKAALRSK